MNEKGIRLTGCAGKTTGENGKKGTEPKKQGNATVKVAISRFQ